MSELPLIIRTSIKKNHILICLIGITKYYPNRYQGRNLQNLNTDILSILLNEILLNTSHSFLKSFLQTKKKSGLFIHSVQVGNPFL